jgi:hypothetical protein
VERHDHCLGLQVIVLQQTLLDDQIALVAIGRQPLLVHFEIIGRSRHLRF